LRVLDPGEYPVTRSLVGDVQQRRRVVVGLNRRSVGTLDGVAVRAAVAGNDLAAFVEERGTSQLLKVALAAASFDVLRRQNGLLPLFGSVVRFLNRRSRTLSPMTGGAAKIGQRVRITGCLRKATLLTSTRLGSFSPRWHVVQRSVTCWSGSQIC